MKPPARLLWGVATATLWFGFLRCAGSVPEQAMSRPVPSPPRLARADAGGPWPYRQVAQRRSYVVEQRALLRIEQDTSSRVDTVTAHAEVAFLALAETGRVVGAVSSFHVQQGDRKAAVPAGLSLPFSFVAEFTARGRQLTFSAPATAAPCLSPALGVVQSLRDLWFQAPDTLRPGTTWEDSISYLFCRDGVPLRASVRRSFRVTGADDRTGVLVLTISRTASASIEGEGAQFAQPVQVAGSSAGELSYRINPAGGEILSARGAAVLQFTLRSRLRTQRARQVSEIRIERGL